MMKKIDLIGRLNNTGIKNRFLFFRIFFLLTGILSTIWFLIRVIPKPSRAAYPCMRAAAPMMSGFVLYIAGIIGSSLAFRYFKKTLSTRRYWLATAFIFSAVAFTFLMNLSLQTNSSAGTKALLIPPDGSNNPMGTELGIFPGRVVWAWNPDATDENCTNKYNDASRGEDGYFMAKNNNQAVIDNMIRESIMKIGGGANVQQSLDNIFKDFNQRKGVGANGYTAGQKVFIKINEGGADWLSDANLARAKSGWQASYYGMAENNPATLLAVLKVLINDYEIPQNAITIADPKAHVFKETYDMIHAVFPNVIFGDRQDKSSLGRTKISASALPAIKWSDKGSRMTSATQDYLYAEMENANYLINLACLKAHARAGVTLIAKNHFGSHTRASAEHLHPGLPATENDVVNYSGYNKYRVLTDIMGHKKLGRNTVLNIVDGLWGGTEAVEKPVKWQSAPFNNDWPSSIFMSQDQVALESVCLDFLRTEFTSSTGPGKARPQFVGVDDHLHQAADSKNWPNGVTYDPEGDGSPIPSLGVHEHWKSAAKKQYARNLGKNYGIELVAITPTKQINNAPRYSSSSNSLRVPGAGAQYNAIPSLKKAFTDPDNDPVNFFATSLDPNLTVSIVQDTILRITSSASFRGPGKVAVSAFDASDTNKVELEVYNSSIFFALETTTPPIIDGNPSDACWSISQWMPIDQIWIPWGGQMDPKDFTGQFKVCWSASENLMYFLVEVVDDSIVDGYVYKSSPSNNNYPDYDIVEVFIDEDRSKGKHVFDGTGQTGTDWGTNAENAFSYHIAANQPAIGDTTRKFAVCDIAGTSWGSYNIPNYASHFPAYVMKRIEKRRYYHEFSLKVYKDTYNPASPNETTRATLSKGKVMGLSVAYCDNDSAFAGSKRDNFIGSVYVPQSRYNDHWMNALDFGEITLVGSDGPNYSPEVTQTLSDLVITEFNKEFVIANDLNSNFNDPDGDILDYTVEYSDPNLTVSILDDKLTATASSPFAGPVQVVVKASDGELTVSQTIEIDAEITAIQEKGTSAFEVYPNPSSGGVIHVKVIDNGLIESSIIRIVNTQGREVMRFEPKEARNEYRLNISGIKQGMYIIQIERNNEIQSVNKFYVQ